MYKRLSKEEKLELVRRIKSGEKISKVCREAGISRTILYRWLKPSPSPSPSREREKKESPLPLGEGRGEGGQARTIGFKHRHWKKFPTKIENKIVKVALRNPLLSPKAIAQLVNQVFSSRPFDPFDPSTSSGQVPSTHSTGSPRQGSGQAGQAGSGLRAGKLRARTITERVSPHGVWNVLKRNNLNTRQAREIYIHNNGDSLIKSPNVNDRVTMMRRLENGERVSDICRDFKVSRTVFYRWLKRYNQAQPDDDKREALKNLRPNGERHWRFVPGASDLVLQIVLEHPEFSAQKISGALFERAGKKLLGNHGVHNLLKRLNLNTYQRRLAYTKSQEAIITPAPQVARGWRIPIFGEIPSVSALAPPSSYFKKVISSKFFISFLSVILLGFASSVVLSNLGYGQGLVGKIGILFSFVALLFGMIFFVYSLKYYLTIAIVLSFSRRRDPSAGSGQEGDRGNRGNKAAGLKADLSAITLQRHPFVSIHIAAYNEKRVVERLLKAVSSMDYDNYEVIIIDDSTDETTQIIKDFLSNLGEIASSPSTNAQGSRNDNNVFSLSSRGSGSDRGDLPNTPSITLIHRNTREGFKGGALREALKHTDPKAEFVMVFDADFIPYSDTIVQFLKYFQVTAGSLDFTSLSSWRESRSTSGLPIGSPGGDAIASPGSGQYPASLQHDNKSNIAAVQGYQWHVLNKSENWITRGVRSEYAGSYVIERSGEEIYAGLKQISGSVYMIKREILEKIGWGTSLTEDFQLTLKLYEQGYKVVYTPYIQAPAEAVSTIKRLIRQRMRWAEGHSHNIRKMFVRLLFGRWEKDLTIEDRKWKIGVEGRSLKVDALSSTFDLQNLPSTLNHLPSKQRTWKPSPLTLPEKLEFLYLSPYYLQAAFFIFGTLSWFIAEVIFKVRLPFWTEIWGWSLVFTNLLALPLMNMVGLFMEESEERDYLGLISFIILSYIVAPFQGYAALKGFLAKEEGPWFRTPKTGRITDTFMPGRLYRWVRGIFGGRVATSSTLSTTNSALMTTNLAYSSVIARSSSLQNDEAISEIAARTSFARNDKNGILSGFLHLKLFGLPAFKFAKRYVFAKATVAVMLVFSILMNYFALGLPSDVPKAEAQESHGGPTILNKTSADSKRLPRFEPEIEKINGSASSPQDGSASSPQGGESEFVYKANLDGDNLVLFGKERSVMNLSPTVIASEAKQSQSNEIATSPTAPRNDNRIESAVARIVSSQGKYVEFSFDGITDGPRVKGDKVIYETDYGLFSWQINESKLKEEIVLYEPPSHKASEGQESQFNIGLTMSGGLSLAQRDKEGYQIVDDAKKETVFFLDNPTIKGADGKKGDITMTVIARSEGDPSFVIANVVKQSQGTLGTGSAISEIAAPLSASWRIGARNDIILKVDQSFLDYAKYPVTIDPTTNTNPSSPVFNIEDKRDNPASDYSFEAKQPRGGDAVYFGDKKDDSVGYKVVTESELYQMELKLRSPCSVIAIRQLTEKQSQANGIAASPTAPRNDNCGENAKVEGNKISWDEGNMTTEYEVWNDRVKANYILKEKPQAVIATRQLTEEQSQTEEIAALPLVARNDTMVDVLSFDLYQFSMIPIENEDGSISLFGDDGYGDSNNSEIFKLDTPNVKDANGREGRISMSLSDEPPSRCAPPEAGRRGATPPGRCTGLRPEKLVPKYCEKKVKECKEPEGYYDRNGTITLTIDKEFLNTASYPITIDPTTLDSTAIAGATAYGSQRHILINSDNDLVAFYMDSDGDIDASYSNDNGTTWTVLSNVYVGNLTDSSFGAAIDSSNNVSISLEDSDVTDILYIKITNMITANDIDGTWTISSTVALDTSAFAHNPSIVIDKNAFPAVAWSFETTGGTKDSAVRFSRADADPTVSTNWTCATNVLADCTYDPNNNNCTTGVCGDHIKPVSGVNTISHPVIVKAPSTATNADELVIMALWESLADLYSMTATVNGANYNTWTVTSREGTSDTNIQDLSAISVDDGTNQRIWVAWDDAGTDPAIRLSFLNADDNTWTSDADTGAGEASMTGDSPSLAYDAQEEDIYVWDIDKSVDTRVEFRKFDINGAAWDSADQVFDVPTAATQLTMPNLKENNAPTTSPGPKLDLIYTHSTGPTVFYSTWHTKETRNYNNPAALPTTEALTITSADNNLSFFYDEDGYTDSNSDNAVYVPNSTSTTTAFVVQTFKKTNANSTDEIQISWNGLKVTEACGSGATACTLQIYQWGNTGGNPACSAGWGDFDSGTRTDTTTAAGTEFTLTGTKTTTNVGCYYSGSDADDHLGTGTVAVRVQTDCTTNCNLRTDVITFIFVPEQTLWLLPFALFLPRIVQWYNNRKLRFRKVYTLISAD